MADLTASAPAGDPIGYGERIPAMDLTRGVALLGIFFVNIQSFGEPFGRFFDQTPQAGEGPPGAAAFYFVKILCEGKFYALFSLLFGMGLVVQMNRARAAGRRFGPIYLRRLGALALLGLAHGILLWYGDILLLYSLVGVWLLLLARLSARTLAIVAACVLLIITTLTMGFTVVAMLLKEPDNATAAGMPPEKGPAATNETIPATSEDQPRAPAPGAPPPQEKTDDSRVAEGPTQPVTEGAADAKGPTEPASDQAGEKAAPRRPIRRLLDGLRTMDRSSDTKPMAQPFWTDAETEAFRHGPFADATAFRAVLVILFMIFCLLGFGWSVLAMFMLGAALMKWEIFRLDDRRRWWHRRLVIVGLAFGLPGCIAMAAAPALLGDAAAILVMIALTYLAPPALMLAYFGAICLWSASGRAAGLARLIAAAGRMALTVYLAESVISAAFFYHWGLGMFAHLSRPERFAFVVVVYALLVLLASAWLNRFRMGPMEWLWKCVTYWKVQRLR